MLSRWIPPTDEASSILRLLNLLPWDDAITPLILCGPFYIGVDFFEKGNLKPPHRVNEGFDPFSGFSGTKSAAAALIKWRMNLLGMLTSQAGVLGEYFPSENRRTVLSRLYTCLDSLFPLIDAMEAAGRENNLTVTEIYARNLAPEQNTAKVIDSSMTSWIPQLMPHILTGTCPIPPLVFDMSGCLPDDPLMDQFVSLLRQICVKREKMRNFLSTLFNTLCGDGMSNWLRDTIVVIVKMALLGNYPDATAFVDLRHRRQIYHLTHETILQYLGNCAGDRSQMRETELAAAVSLIATSLVSTFSPNSIDYRPMDHFVTGWGSFFRTCQRTMQLLVDFYPQPPPSNLMLDSFRFLSPLTKRYANVFYLIHSLFPVPLDYISWWPVLKMFETFKKGPTMAQLTRLDSLELAILLQMDPMTLLTLQKEFDTMHALTLHHLSDAQWQLLASLARYLVDRWAMQVIAGSQSLFFEQSARMYAITGRLAKEKSTVLYCQKCNTVRFRPVGVHLPASHITLLADLNFTRVFCVDCDGSDIVPINLMGQFVRCYLSTKKTRTLVTLTLCSACMHICVVGFFYTNSGVICSECQSTVQNMILLPLTKHCLVCSALVQRPEPDQFWTVFEGGAGGAGLLKNAQNKNPRPKLKTLLWCSRCMPASMKRLAQASSSHPSKTALPLFDQTTLLQLSHVPYSVPMKYRHY
jgi:hypothetical protein